MHRHSVITLKRGDTLLLHCELQSSGAAVSVAGWQIDCWLRSPDGRRVAALAVDLTDAAAGRWRLRAAPAQTRDWPAGDLAADIRYRDPGGRVMHSTTFTVHMLRAVTTPTP